MSSPIRVARELKKFYSQDCPSVICIENHDDLSRLVFTLKCPEGTPHEGMKLCVQFVFPSDYPFVPPQVKVLTSIFHPNISQDGHLCLEVLSSKWKTSNTIKDVLDEIQSLIVHPNLESPINIEAATLFQEDKEAYQQKVKSSTTQT